MLLAEGYAIGGNHLLFWMPDILAGLALLAFFVLAWRLLRRPWFAVAATAAFAFVLPQVNFARDTYSEIPSEILVFTAVWLLTTRRAAPPWRVTLVAGLFLGTMQAVRIDALGFVLGVPLLLAVGWLRAERVGPQERLRLVRSALALVGGGLAGFVLGYLDLTRRSQSYYSLLSGNVHSLEKGLVVAAVFGTIVVLLWPRRASDRSKRAVALFANGAGAVVLAAGFAAWALRPHFFTMRGQDLPIADLQTAEHQVVDLTRTYFEFSLTWMSWYLGPITLAAAIVGVALLTRALLRGGHLHALAAVVVFGPMSALYLWKANAFPDQVWVDRRYLCSAIPALLLLGFGVAAWLWDARPRPPFDRPARAVAAGIALIGVGAAVYATAGVRDMSSQHGYLAVMDDTCRLVGEHAAVVAVGRGSQDLTPEWIAQPLRSWCGADVAVMLGAPDTGTLHDLATRARALGRTLYVVGSPNAVGGAGVASSLHRTREVVNGHLLEQSLTHRPDRYVVERFSLAVERVDPG